MTYSLFLLLADTLYGTLQGILRGYKDTIVPFCLGLLGYWGVGIPLGLYLDYSTSLGAYSYWIALIISLMVKWNSLSVAFTSYCEKIQMIC